jgi:hypothetical protein
MPLKYLQARRVPTIAAFANARKEIICLRIRIKGLRSFTKWPHMPTARLPRITARKIISPAVSFPGKRWNMQNLPFIGHNKRTKNQKKPLLRKGKAFSSVFH